MTLYRSVEDAIRRRFERYSEIQADRFPTFTAQGGAALIGPGSNMPTSSLLPTKIRTILGGKPISVPVYYEDKGGQDASTWPAISFRMESEEPRLDNYREGDALVRCVGMAEGHPVSLCLGGDFEGSPGQSQAVH